MADVKLHLVTGTLASVWVRWMAVMHALCLAREREAANREFNFNGE